MKALRLCAVIAVALALQTTLARFLVRGAIGVDLGLVAVVYLSLTSGPRTGIVAGTVAGLAQDALTSGIVGIGGLAKALVGYLAGTFGSAFIVTRPLPRFVVFFVSTLVEMTVVTLFHLALDPGPPALNLGGIVAQSVGNAMVGIVVFQLAEVVPRAIEERKR